MFNRKSETLELKRRVLSWKEKLFCIAVKASVSSKIVSSYNLTKIVGVYKLIPGKLYLSCGSGRVMINYPVIILEIGPR